MLGLALADFAGHMLVSTNYDYFRDELYYIMPLPRRGLRRRGRPRL